jgi:Flp pilus assembly pilin Flp
MPLLTKLKCFGQAVVRRRRDDGQDLLEYALLMALISIFAMGAVTTLGNTINTIFWQSIASNF